MLRRNVTKRTNNNTDTYGTVRLYLLQPAAAAAAGDKTKMDVIR